MIYYPLLPSIHVSAMAMMVAFNHEMILACNTHAHTPQGHVYNKYTINEAFTKHIQTRLHRELQTATEAVSPCLGLFSAGYSVTMTHTRSHVRLSVQENWHM